MESILGLIGTIIGCLGFALAVFVAIRQVKIEKMYAKEHVEKKGRRAHGLEMYAKELEIQKQEMTRTERLMFLTDRIFDPYIPKEFKLPFYKEYISMEGNGTAVRFWQLEAEREKKMIQPS
jgi:hypothetical protein